MPKLPASVGKYKILERLGRGGMSVIYKAEHPTLGTPVVLKKLTLKGDSAHRERFRREAALMMGLRHENVVGVFDHFKEGNGYYLVMEYVDGRPLSELLAREGSLEAQEAAWLIGEISRALAHIHENGIVHRDLKPSNILLSRNTVVKLGDFGIAFAPGGDDDITTEGTALGTPSFMAPEQLEDARLADERSDIWSLGICFFELLTGRKFISGPTPAAIREALPEAVRTMSRRLPPSLPRRYRRFLRRCIRMRPESRLSGGGAAMRRMSRNSGIPSSLVTRLNGLFRAMNPPEDDTPPIDVSQDSRSIDKPSLSFGSLFKQAENRQPSSREGDGEHAGRNLKIRFRRPRLLMLLGIPVLLFFVLITVPGLWDELLRPDSHGRLELALIYPPEAPDHWLTAVEARIYRLNNEDLVEVAEPVLRRSRDGNRLISRKLSLPAGSYRMSWSLGDRIVWRSFRVPSIQENRSNNLSSLILEETLGEPPVFPLEIRWKVSDAINGKDLSGPTKFSWERLDLDGGDLESGGSYAFTFEVSGYSPQRLLIATSPWRRSLSMDIAVYPTAGTIRINNVSGKTGLPHLDGSRRYIDLAESPTSRRIPRLNDGDSIGLTVLPGRYLVAPGMGESGAFALELQADETVDLYLSSGEDGQPRIGPDP